MATRLYFANHRFQPALHVPAFDAAWDDTDDADRRYMDGSPGTTSSADLISTKAAAGPLNCLVAQYLLPGLAAQTITGNVKGQCRFDSSSVTGDPSTQMVIRVWDPVTDTFRGTLLAAHSSATNASAGAEGYEIATNSANRKLPSGWSGTGAALSSVAASLGDVLVVEVGAKFDEVAASSRQVTVHGENSLLLADLPEDETTVTDLNPWIEFSNTITFHPVAPVIRGDSAGCAMPRTFHARNAGQPAAGAAVPTAGQIWPRGNRGV